MNTIVLVTFIIPFIWSAGLAGLRRIFHPTAHDALEKRYLLLMLLPVVLGLAAISVGRYLPVGLPLPVTGFDDGMPADTSSTFTMTLAPDHKALPAFSFVAPELFGLYAAGVLINATRLIAGFLRLRIMATRARPEQILGEEVRLTPLPSPPLAVGRRTILLPETLVSRLSPLQLDLIVAHERAHLKRGDSLWFAVLAWVDAVFWFNPFVRHQTHQCRLAAELACDAAVTAAAPEMRGIYAETLVKILKHAAGDVRQYAPTAFSPEKSGDYRMRITEIMRPPAKSGKPRLLVAGVAAALLVPLGVAQFAWSQAAPAQSAGPVRLSVAPVPGPVNSPFGMRTNPVTHKWSMHDGVDFKASVGTPVKAAGDGTVTRVYEERWHMGKVIQIDHGDGLTTLYTHLDTQKVAVGDHVTAGQVIATSGASGVSTGPHLHFEVQKDGKSIDPLQALGLKAIASSTAEPFAPAILFKACGNTDASRCDFSSDHVAKAGDGVIVMTGSVRLHQGAQTVQADQVRWNTNTGALNLKGHIVATNTTVVKAL